MQAETRSVGVFDLMHLSALVEPFLLKIIPWIKHMVISLWWMFFFNGLSDLRVQGSTS